jgi:hypothetical protein
MTSARVVALAVALVACGHGGDGPTNPPPPRKDGGIAIKDAPVELPALALGMPDLASFQWRKRAGQPAFRAARKAEDREDWKTVAVSAGEALAADPGHLEAAWLLAVARAKTGQLDGVLAPLTIAAAGDLGKWGLASLEQPALQPWLATPTGDAWRRRVEQDRQIYAAAIARAVIVAAAGDLYAFDPDTSRWYRLTRTYGAVASAFAAPAGHELAYVTRTKKATSVGLVDLTRGHSTRPTSLGTAPPPIAIAHSTAKPIGFWIGNGAAWRQIDDDGKFHPLAPKAARPAGTWLEVFAHTARLHRLPVANVSADWDDQSLASAMRLGTSNRNVSVPSPGLIDGNTVVWSPDRAHLAFVAQLDDHCTPGAASVSAAAFVADASTGSVRELERASGGLAVEWISDRKLALVGDHGVELIALDGTPPQPLEGADGLVTPRRKPRCTPEPSEESTTPEDED